MAKRGASRLLAAGLLVALALLTAPTVFVPQPASPEQLPAGAVVAATAGAAAASTVGVPAAFAAEVQQQLLEGSSVAMAWQPWENPGIVWIFLMASFTMSIALVVWGRNGF
mmetsp:Transcript_59028/g.192557  ORF Transcript_59028/g.192557 Transcript_59028/m.192557 type:complete len:111 (-) Transcript_59028:146-478(-)